MPCMDYAFASMYVVRPSALSTTDVIPVFAIIMGLTYDNEESSGYDLWANYRRERIFLSNHLLLKGKYKSAIRRVFILSMRNEEIIAWFIPNQISNDDDHQKKNNNLTFDPVIQFINNYDEHGNAAIDNEELCRQSMVVKSGKLTIDVDGLCSGVGGSYGNNESVKLAYLERFTSTSLSSLFAIPKNSQKGSRKSKISLGFFSFFKSKKKSNPFKSLCQVDNVLCTIFEFIDSIELINVVASVSTQFHKLIIYSQEAGSQIFGGRITQFFKKNTVLNMKDLMKMHQTETWIEFYLLSGMIFIENYKNEMFQSLSTFESTENLLFILDPTIFIKNRTILNLIEKKRKKIIAISKTETYPKVTNIIPFCESEEEFLKSILYSPLVSSSIDFKKGLHLYLQFLTEMTNKLKDTPLLQDPNQLWKFEFMCEKILEKATHFLNESKTKYFDYAPDDVLIGLHFILLDNYFIGDEFVYLDFTKLLENRNSFTELSLCKCQFPKDLEIDYLQFLLEGNEVSIPTKHSFNRNLFFQRSLEANGNQVYYVNKYLKGFFNEHIFDLSKVAIGLESDYISFLKQSYSSRPTKQVDLYFHFHMLHSIQYYQECKEIAPYLKSHILIFDN